MRAPRTQNRTYATRTHPRTRTALLALLTLLGGLLAVATTASPAAAAPNFKAPYGCGQQWTYSHHSAEVRRALDFVRTDGGATAGSPVLASAAGTAYRHSQPSGAGNYISIDHGGGWQTYYFHLNAFSVANGARVAQGQQIGTTGSTGNSSGAHIHYEQLLNGVGQNIVINGQSLSPYPGSYYNKYLTSDNGCGGGSGRYWVDTFANATGYAAPTPPTRRASSTPVRTTSTARCGAPASVRPPSSTTGGSAPTWTASTRARTAATPTSPRTTSPAGATTRPATTTAP